MGSAVSDRLPKLLLRRIEAGPGAVLWGRDAAPHFGRSFDQLLAEGILTERAPATSWSLCRICDGDCGERDIAEVDGGLVAECPQDSAHDTPLAAHEIRSFAVDVPALVGAIATRSGLAGDCEQIAGGVWFLGRLTGGRSVVLVLEEAGVRGPGGVAALRARATLAGTTILVPGYFRPPVMRPFRDAGCHVLVSMDALDGDDFVLNHATLLPPVTHDARIAINRSSQAVALDGRPVPLTDQPYRLLVVLAEIARLHPGFLNDTGIEEAVYRNDILPSARPVRDIVRELRDQLAAGLSTTDADAIRSLIQSRRSSGYRLQLKPTEIVIVG